MEDALLTRSEPQRQNMLARATQVRELAPSSLYTACPQCTVCIYNVIVHCVYACMTCTCTRYTVGPVLNAWFNYCVLRFFAYIANLMIAHVDAAAYGVLSLDQRAGSYM